MKDINK